MQSDYMSSVESELEDIFEPDRRKAMTEAHCRKAQPTSPNHSFHPRFNLSNSLANKKVQKRKLRVSWLNKIQRKIAERHQNSVQHKPHTNSNITHPISSLKGTPEDTIYRNTHSNDFTYKDNCSTDHAQTSGRNLIILQKRHSLHPEDNFNNVEDINDWGEGSNLDTSLASNLTKDCTQAQLSECVNSSQPVSPSGHIPLSFIDRPDKFVDSIEPVNCISVHSKTSNRLSMKKLKKRLSRFHCKRSAHSHAVCSGRKSSKVAPQSLVHW